ncbi:MAG: hypothetical protein A2Y12_12300 [Planctomycetes bacterium GWF2_42_9]|nr:MAG: hypothetical protein A2Y12_12300 [Planctomycetes bacterium GWF2_42_9]
MPGGAPGLQNQRESRTRLGWVRFPFASAIFKIMTKEKKINRFITFILLLAAGALLYIGLFRTLKVQNLPLEKMTQYPKAYQPVLYISESQAIFDITLGGLVKLDSGGIQRTYDMNNKPASLCPT